MNYEPSKEAREDCFRAFILPERGLDSPLTSSLIPPCYDESLPSASPTVAGRRRAHTHTHAHTEQSSCSASAVGVWGMLMSVQRSSLCLSVHWPQCQLPPVWFPRTATNCAEALFIFVFFSLFPQFCSVTLSLCYTHSLLIWSSVGQRGSSESQECWQARLINGKWGGEELHLLASPFLRCATGPET